MCWDWPRHRRGLAGRGTGRTAGRDGHCGDPAIDTAEHSMGLPKWSDALAAVNQAEAILDQGVGRRTPSALSGLRAT